MPPSTSRAIVLPTTFTSPRVRAPRRFASRSAASVSAVSPDWEMPTTRDRKSTRLNSSHGYISYAVFCLKKKKKRKSIILIDVITLRNSIQHLYNTTINTDSKSVMTYHCVDELVECRTDTNQLSGLGCTM